MPGWGGWQARRPETANATPIRGGAHVRALAEVLEQQRGDRAALRRTGRDVDDEVLAHIWPAQHENVHFDGTHSVDIDGELAQLDTDGYRPLRLAAVASAGS